MCFKRVMGNRFRLKSSFDCARHPNSKHSKSEAENPLFFSSLCEATCYDNSTVVKGRRRCV